MSSDARGGEGVWYLGNAPRWAPELRSAWVLQAQERGSIFLPCPSPDLDIYYGFFSSPAFERYLQIFFF